VRPIEDLDKYLVEAAVPQTHSMGGGGHPNSFVAILEGGVTVTLKVVEHLAIATRSLRAASAGRAYSARVRLTGGARPFKWTARGLPRGLKLSTGGVLTGSPAAAGTYRLQLRVRDVLGATSSRTLTLAVL
jgi:putative Ig domain-containing protein